ncbi:PREDICTED: uncharacterized protein LOC104771814 [Camelina sativa]|uniref:Uncharacterized protein LOC104771814 n=1 Tax=Camelina sativa TaxID=90675 RepID=A0ABM0Y348_CAMSA|nr:PREDICTED: uncharacterized protein LOC104771814 [Camelina sativa]XP_010494709.1 PREDICTED: uncharacterized protein LOC104771814 [Camelina sativa]XP_010494710.1 PREDICTED: uncharacterized protein LOC104771814 [Camelina sativa]XP_010494711.1 PREDICTED: uncharacterized protein LOC104771814 [Camelina sativa]XP_010494713.1 PREDICTED: uncharacterized protein LOC104771814 [Camelina sativa]XP_010494714.1 PREDICTED: uncharacterized protein LOC104771814 [Camelina sativa]XP_010494715.1 PREDICTED: unc
MKKDATAAVNVRYFKDETRQRLQNFAVYVFLVEKDILLLSCIEITSYSKELDEIKHMTKQEFIASSECIINKNLGKQGLAVLPRIKIFTLKSLYRDQESILDVSKANRGFRF